MSRGHCALYLTWWQFGMTQTAVHDSKLPNFSQFKCSANCPWNFYFIKMIFSLIISVFVRTTVNISMKHITRNHNCHDASFSLNFIFRAHLVFPSIPRRCSWMDPHCLTSNRTWSLLEKCMFSLSICSPVIMTAGWHVCTPWWWVKMEQTKA